MCCWITRVSCLVGLMSVELSDMNISNEIVQSPMLLRCQKQLQSWSLNITVT